MISVEPISVKFREDPYRMGIDLYVTTKCSRKTHNLTQEGWAPVSEESAPLVFLDKCSASEVLDSLLLAGIKPTTSLPRDQEIEMLRANVELLKDVIEHLCRRTG